MLSRDLLLNVRELNLAGKTDSMSDAQFADYITEINRFIDTFPTHEKRLQNAVSKKDYSSIAGLLTEACGVLSGINADDLAREYVWQASRVGPADHDAAELLVENFIQRTSALSIDIQMAMHQNKKSAQPHNVTWTTSGKPTVLAVDNAIMFLNTLKKLLQNAPYDLFCTSSCSEALQFCRDNRPAIILLDVEMPEMDGYELARRIKSCGQKAPILFVTANSDREYVDKAIEVDAVGLLVKPLRISQLLEKLKEFV